ncbi:MAG: zf-TFIIB protein [Acidobacteriota bacterium]|nr:zf-TFIIB protein [Acidobacteriota bacterium]
MSDSNPPRARRPAPPRPATAAPPHFRRLVRCETCFKQFDAGEMAPGERFRCLCGALLAVPASAAQEAPVVRCASCGAPRAAGAVNCTFCSAPFVLGEGERNTLCPVCASRIGDLQRFCHSCGTRIAPEALASERSEYSCPSCRPARRLSSRRIPDSATALSMLECGSCAGIWLGHPTFDALQERARRETPPEPLAPAGRPEADRVRAGKKITYRPCPICRKLMVRRAFAGSSGVVLDVCGAHGLWFDSTELEATLAWIRGGGLTRAEERLAAERKEAARREAIAKQEFREVVAEKPAEAQWIELLGELADLVLGAIGRRR